MKNIIVVGLAGMLVLPFLVAKWIMASDDVLPERRTKYVKPSLRAFSVN